MFEKLWRGSALWILLSFFNVLLFLINLQYGNFFTILLNAACAIWFLVFAFLDKKYKTPPWKNKW